MAERPILVTGSAGFIGYSVVNRLLADGHRVVGFDSLDPFYPPLLKEARLAALAGRSGFHQEHGNLSDGARLRAVFRQYRPVRVCNLAAQAGVRYSLRNPQAYVQANVAGFVELVECCRHHDVERLVYASSSSVYGKSDRLPFRESDPLGDQVSFYGVTKRSNELTAQTYAHLFGLRSVGLRFFTVYGPWGRPDMAMWIFAERIIRDLPIPVFNAGKMRRDFTYIDDIVNGIVNAIFHDRLAACEIFNLGNNQCVELIAMIQQLEAALGRKAKMDMEPFQPGDMAATYADIGKAAAQLGFKPETPINVGIPAFCDWYRAHPDLADAIARWRAEA